MRGYNPKPKPKESEIQNKIKKKLESKGWYVKVTSGNIYQQGFPDLYAVHPLAKLARWIEVKRPTGYKVLESQKETFTMWAKAGVGVYILSGDSEEEINKLYGLPNWWSYL